MEACHQGYRLVVFSLVFTLIVSIALDFCSLVDVVVLCIDQVRKRNQYVGLQEISSLYRAW